MPQRGKNASSLPFRSLCARSAGCLPNASVGGTGLSYYTVSGADFGEFRRIFSFYDKGGVTFLSFFMKFLVQNSEFEQ